MICEDRCLYKPIRSRLSLTYTMQTNPPVERIKTSNGSIPVHGISPVGEEKVQGFVKEPSLKLGMKD